MSVVSTFPPDIKCHASQEACELKFVIWAEMWYTVYVTPRKRRVSWNCSICGAKTITCVTPRKRRVSWNHPHYHYILALPVTPRKRRVSWNCRNRLCPVCNRSHASQEACELKYRTVKRATQLFSHASQEACELKWAVCQSLFEIFRHASQEACELKLFAVYPHFRFEYSHASQEACELKCHWY